MMLPFWIALQFLTTFPVQLKEIPSAKQNAQSLLFYPLVGLLIGLLLWGVALCLQGVPLLLLSALIVSLWVWLTGGLHLDGLADTADAWVGGYGDAERTLSIMKDPSCGPIGVLSLLMCCGLKWAAVYVLLQQQYCMALILFPLLSRIAPLILFLTTPYVRKNGLGSDMNAHLPRYPSILIIILASLGCAYWGIEGLFTWIFFFAGLVYLRAKFIQRIGGITGDTIGATIEILETLMLVTFVILKSTQFI